MRSSFPVFLLLGSVCAFPQDSGTTPELVPITDDTVVAKVNGTDFTAGDLERILQDVRPDLRKAAGVEPQKFLEDYAHGLLLKEEAIKGGLDRAKPYRGKIEKAIREILVNAVIAEKTRQITISAEEIQKAYEDGADGWKQAKVKVIFISAGGYIQDLATKSTRPVTPEQVKEKLDKVLAFLREGKDFAAVAREYSDDSSTADKGADFPFAIRANSESVPSGMKSALLQAKAGDIVGPLDHPTGFYVFRVESVNTAQLDEVKEEIEKRMRHAAVQKWLAETRKKTSVSLVHQPFWNTYVATNKAILESEEKAAASGAGK